MRREYPDAPIAGVGAVIVRAVPPQSQQVLLIRRGQEPLKGEWSLPGGAVELGETLEEAICREVLEETGLVIETVDIVQAFDRISRDTEGRVRYHYVLIDFLCRVKAGSEAPETIACATDALEARWAGPGDLAGLTSLTVEVIHKAWRMAS
ncbi:MAG TPA: NUDIX hydrolase [Acidobacteriaceae bacterium]|jgi:ADP-ribose pyrophosphatase YjhB (NUDIX family)|nr:NUDIX hydrolase [Acidobacteriaceae bacterium]